MLNYMNNSECLTLLNLFFPIANIPAISKPSRIDDAHGSCTLLDNIFVRSSQSFLSGIDNYWHFRH